MKRFWRKHKWEIGIVGCVVALMLVYVVPKLLLVQNINKPENFPDPNFHQAIQTMMGVEPGERITLEQAYAETGTLHPQTPMIEDITGIEYFPNITKLNLRGHLVGKLNLDGFYNLEELSCPGNALTELDLSKLPNLKYLNCRHNQIKHLDFSHNPLLEEVKCENNRLESIVFDNNSHLEKLDCHNNSMLSLDTSSLTNLTYLRCDMNLLTHLDVSHNQQLQVLLCRMNDLEELRLPNNRILEKLFCGSNNLKQLKLYKYSILDMLDCSRNKLSTIDLFDCPNLRSINLSHNWFQNVPYIPFREHCELINLQENLLDCDDYADIFKIKQKFIDLNTSNSNPNYNQAVPQFLYNKQRMIYFEECDSYISIKTRDDHEETK